MHNSEAMPDAFSLYDPDDRLVLCNSHFREFYPNIADILVPGVSFEKACRANVASGHIPKAKGREEEWIQERLEMHRNPKEPHLLLTDDERWIQISERRTSDGGFLGIRTDITERKQAEGQLIRTVSLLDATLNSTADGILVVDLDQNVSSYNRKFLELWKNHGIGYRD